MPEASRYSRFVVAKLTTCEDPCRVNAIRSHFSCNTYKSASEKCWCMHCMRCIVQLDLRAVAGHLRDNLSPTENTCYTLEAGTRCTISARRTLILTSTLEPRRLMIDIKRSTVNRPRSALRIREKSAAAIPVRPCAPRTLRPSRPSALMISAARMALT